MTNNKKLSNKQLDKEIAKESKKAKQAWKKRFDLIQEVALVAALVSASIFSYAKGIFEISSNHLEAMIAMLVVVAVSCVLIRKKV